MEQGPCLGAVRRHPVLGEKRIAHHGCEQWLKAQELLTRVPSTGPESSGKARSSVPRTMGINFPSQAIPRADCTSGHFPGRLRDRCSRWLARGWAIAARHRGELCTAQVLEAVGEGSLACSPRPISEDHEAPVPCTRPLPGQAAVLQPRGERPRCCRHGAAGLALGGFPCQPGQGDR